MLLVKILQYILNLRETVEIKLVSNEKKKLNGPQSQHSLTLIRLDFFLRKGFSGSGGGAWGWGGGQFDSSFIFQEKLI